MGQTATGRKSKTLKNLMLRCSAQQRTGCWLKNVIKTIDCYNIFLKVHANTQRNSELSRAISPSAGKRKKVFKAIMKFGLEDVCSEVLEGLGRRSFHATFHAVGENNGDRNK